jgi:hypothetical protein
MKVFLGFSLCSLFILTGLPVAALAAEWEHVRTPTEEDLGDVVASRRAHSGEDAYKLFRVKNNYLYEDDKWLYSENFTDEVESISFKRIDKKDEETIEYKTWSMFKGIAGEPFIKKHIGYYSTYRDKNEPILASVWNPLTTPSKKSLWLLSVNMNAADFNKPKWRQDMAIVLTHEFAHILTLNSTQVKFSRSKTQQCSSAATPVKTAMGCAYKKSYIAGYAKAFWDEKDNAHAQEVGAAEDEKATRSLVSKYYKAHQNDFVTR